jgi:hypothetical protein
MCEQLNNECYVCRSAIGPGPPSDHIDHEHALENIFAARKLRSLTVRGPMCAKCNQGMGYFNDDPLRMMKAASWLLSPRNPDHLVNSFEYGLPAALPAESTTEACERSAPGSTEDT